MFIDGSFDLTTEDIEHTERARQLYTLFDGPSAIEEQVANTLPRKLLRRRGAQHQLLFPDDLQRFSEEAMRKYQEAKDTGLFVFYIATPTYNGVAQRSSWLVAQVSCNRWWVMITPID